MAKQVAEQMELFGNRGFSVEKTEEGTITRDGNMPEEMAKRLERERKAAPTSEGKTPQQAAEDAAAYGMQGLEEELGARTRFKEMQRMLTTGKTADMSDEEKRAFVEEYKKLKNEYNLNEGGLLDEGGMIDEESGNDVPSGSLREEVRDDIPAQLSEGEFVFPADVVRYIGLENLMRMRQEAKQGLAQMEAMGQMGNSEEATMPDDLPFDMYDLDIEDDNNMSQGGMPTMKDPRDDKGGFVTFNNQTGYIADLSTIPDSMRDKIQVRPA